MINYSRMGYEIKRDFSKFALKISQNLKRPQQKFVMQMLYGILAGNKVHLSEIARSLNESITLKKTIDRLSRNLKQFSFTQQVMQEYIALVKNHVKDDYAVIIIDNSDIAKPASQKLEALSEVRDGSTGEITKGYQTIEAAILSKTSKMPIPVYEKVFSAAEHGFISETHENLCCLKALSENFSPKCVRTLDRGFDANEYYRYFLTRGKRFIIRAKKNRSVTYKDKTINIMELASLYKGAYRMDFKDKKGKKVECKMSCIPVKLCEFPKKDLTLVVVYGLGKEPMLLLTNLNIQEKKKLCQIITKVYLMRWRIEEYFKFKKQQFEFEDIRLMSLQSIRNMNFFATLAVGYIALTSEVHSGSMYLAELKECAKRIYEIPKFIFYALGYAIETILSMSRCGIEAFLPRKLKSQQLTLFLAL